MAQISARVRAALFGALSARFNTLLANLAPGYGIPIFTIDFASQPRSTSFFWGAIDPADIEDSTVYKLPLMTLYTLQSSNQHLQKPAYFSGMVRMGCDVVLSWRGGNAQQNFEAQGDAIEEVMNTISNELALQGNWPVKMTLDRSPVKRGQQNWWQMLRFSFLFDLHV